MSLLQTTHKLKLYPKNIKIKDSRISFNIKRISPPPPKEKAGMAELTADKTEFKAKKISRNKK